MRTSCCSVAISSDVVRTMDASLPKGSTRLLSGRQCLRPLPDRPYAVGLTITNVENAASINTDAMGSSERAPTRIGLGAVASLTGAEHGANDACLQINRADHVILGVGHIERVARPGKALWPRQLRHPSLAAIAGVTLLPGPGHMV